MGCACEKPKKPCAGQNPLSPITIVNEEKPVLFHQVIRPASLGDDTAVPADQLDYKNVLLVYQANGHAYLYSSDGVPTFISYLPTDTTELKQALDELQAQLTEEINSRTEADSTLENKIETNSIAIEQNAAAIQTQQTSLVLLEQTQQEDFEELNNALGEVEAQTVQKDTTVSGDASTVTITKTLGTLENDGTTETAMPLPVASSTEAGVMNAATFSAVQENSENIDSILGGAVVVSTLPENPTQEQLTDAWKTATSKTELINRASIYDDTNKLVWYYYENADEWKSMPAGDAAVSVSIATNDTPGIVRSSDAPGQITVEPDGSMSQNGYDGMQHDIDNLSELVAGIDVPKVGTYTLEWDSPNKFSYNPDDVQIRLRQTSSSSGGRSIPSAFINSATTVNAGVMSAADKSKLDSLATITAIGENLELTDEGVLNAAGGGEVDVPKVLSYIPGGTSNIPLEWERRAGSLGLHYSSINTTTGVTSNDIWRPLPVVTPTASGIMSKEDKSKLDSLLEIKSLNDSLELDESGQLSVVDNGSDVNLLSEYTAPVGDNDVYGAAYVNSRLNSHTVRIGNAIDTSQRGTLIGSGSVGSESYYNIAIGSSKDYPAKATGQASVAIGYNTTATNTFSVAIGQSASTTRNLEFSIGNNARTRYLANVTAGELPTDAVNLQQMQDYVAEQVGDVATVLETLTTGAGV